MNCRKSPNNDYHLTLNLLPYCPYLAISECSTVQIYCTLSNANHANMMQNRLFYKPVGDMVRSLIWVGANIEWTSVKLTGKLICDVVRLVSIMLIRDDVISDVIRHRSTIREDHIDTLYRGTLCSNIVQFWQELPEKKHFKEKWWRHHYDVIRSRDVIRSVSNG